MSAPGFNPYNNQFHSYNVAHNGQSYTSQPIAQYSAATTTATTAVNHTTFSDSIVFDHLEMYKFIYTLHYYPSHLTNIQIAAITEAFAAAIDIAKKQKVTVALSQTLAQLHIHQTPNSTASAVSHAANPYTSNTHKTGK